MGDVLGRKQRIKNDDWIQALAKIEKLVQKKELDRLAEKTVKEIRKRKDSCLCVERRQGFPGTWRTVQTGRYKPVCACYLQFGVSGIYRMGECP